MENTTRNRTFKTGLMLGETIADKLNETMRDFGTDIEPPFPTIFVQSPKDRQALITVKSRRPSNAYVLVKYEDTRTGEQRTVSYRSRFAHTDAAVMVARFLTRMDNAIDPALEDEVEQFIRYEDMWDLEPEPKSETAEIDEALEQLQAVINSLVTLDEPSDNARTSLDAACTSIESARQSLIAARSIGRQYRDAQRQLPEFPGRSSEKTGRF